MAPVHSLAMFFWQTSYDASARDIHFIMIAEVAIAAILVLVLLGALIAGLVIYSKINRLIEDVKKAAMPAIAKGTELFNDLAPKVRSITSNVEQISYTARAKVDEVGETITQINKTVVDINGKTQVQAARVNGIVTDALDTTHHVSQSIQHGIRVPVQKISAIVAGIKTGVEEFLEHSPIAARFRKQPKNTPPYDL